MSEEKKLNLAMKKEIREQAKNLKPFLPQGSVPKVAKILNVSDALCYDVIAGRRWNLEVLEELIKEGKRNKKRAEKALAELKDMKQKK